MQTHVRSVARYSCSIGYRLVGVTYRQCTQTSQFTVETKWSAKSPKCIRKISIIIPIIVYLLNVYYFAVRCSTLHAPLNEKLLVANSIIHILCCTCVTADTKHFLVTALEMQRNRKMDRYSAIVQRCAINHRSISYQPIKMYFLSGVCEVARLNCSNAEIGAVDSDGCDTCVCKSRSACPLDVRPVCGSDGRNYINECLLEVEACLFGSDSLRTISQGACGKMQYFRIKSKTDKIFHYNCRVLLSCLPFQC